MDRPFDVIDLTHPLTPGGPVWPGDPETHREEAAALVRDGYSLNAWRFGEHTGTHVGAPSHFDGEGPTVDRLPLNRFVLPLAVVRVEGLRNGEAVGREALLADEAAHGRIPRDALVALDTGWTERWPDPERVFERDGDGCLLYPGFSEEAAQWLFAKRWIAGLGSDAPGVDPGPSEAFPAGHLTASLGAIHLENLARLRRVPSRGAWVLIGALPLAGGHGSPARVFALVMNG